MSRFKAIAGVAAFIALVSAPASAATKIQRVISPGGIEAWFVQDATVPLIAMQFSFAGGSAQDPAGKPGVGDLMGNMLDEGAGDLDSNAYHERLERRAIEMAYSVTRDTFRGSLKMLSENRDEAFDLLRLALTAPRFDPEPLERVRSQTISSLRRETTSPGAIASRLFWEQAFGTHPYAQPSNGTLDSVATITAADLKDYARKVLAKDKLHIAVVGDIDPVALGKLLDKTFGSLPAKGDLTPIPEAAVAKPPLKASAILDVPQTNILFGGEAIPRNDPDFMAAYIVNHILAGGTMSSRLYAEVREKRGLAYSIGESLVWLDKASLFIGSTATRADKATETADTIAAQIQLMGDDGPTQQELDEAKSYLKGSQLLALDTSTKIAGALLQYQLDNLGIDYLERRSGIIDAVTLDDAKRVAKRIWSHGLLTVVVGRAAQAAAQPAVK